MVKVMRIYIIGGPGSGKTTLAKRIATHFRISFQKRNHDIIELMYHRVV
jgi:adenylate kinase family enzyme